jgi:hypothetical protein
MVQLRRWFQRNVVRTRGRGVVIEPCFRCWSYELGELKHQDLEQSLSGPQERKIC